MGRHSQLLDINYGPVPDSVGDRRRPARREFGDPHLVRKGGGGGGGLIACGRVLEAQGPYANFEYVKPGTGSTAQQEAG